MEDIDFAYLRDAGQSAGVAAPLHATKRLGVAGPAHAVCRRLLSVLGIGVQ